MIQQRVTERFYEPLYATFRGIKKTSVDVNFKYALGANMLKIQKLIADVIAK
jgi:hypothetical protein